MIADATTRLVGDGVDRPWPPSILMPAVSDGLTGSAADAGCYGIDGGSRGGAATPAVLERREPQSERAAWRLEVCLIHLPSQDRCPTHAVAPGVQALAWPEFVAGLSA